MKTTPKLLFPLLFSGSKVQTLSSPINHYTKPQVADMNHKLVGVNQFKMPPCSFILVWQQSKTKWAAQRATGVRGRHNTNSIKT